MGIFKSVTKLLKKAAPVIGGTIGFAIGGPMGSAALGSALGEYVDLAQLWTTSHDPDKKSFSDRIL